MQRGEARRPMSSGAASDNGRRSGEWRHSGSGWLPVGSNVGAERGKRASGEGGGPPVKKKKWRGGGEEPKCGGGMSHGVGTNRGVAAKTWERRC
jgi:hypothetical protein